MGVKMTEEDKEKERKENLKEAFEERSAILEFDQCCPK